jgi:hypothetical protein
MDGSGAVVGGALAAVGTEMVSHGETTTPVTVRVVGPVVGVVLPDVVDEDETVGAARAEVVAGAAGGASSLTCTEGLVGRWPEPDALTATTTAPQTITLSSELTTTVRDLTTRRV